MARITITLLRDLTRIVKKKISEHRDYLLDSKKHEIEEKQKELYQEKLKEYKLDKIVEELEKADAEVKATENLLKKKEYERRKIYEQIYESLDVIPGYKDRYKYWGAQSCVSSVLSDIEKDAKENAIYHMDDIGPIVKQLDAIEESVYDELVLSSSNVAMQQAVQEIVNKIDKLVQIG